MIARVGASAVLEVAVRVLIVLVGRLDPLAEERRLGLLVRIPIIRRARVAQTRRLPISSRLGLPGARKDPRPLLPPTAAGAEQPTLPGVSF
jgi:hypothetical protein